MTAPNPNTKTAPCDLLIAGGSVLDLDGRYETATETSVAISDGVIVDVGRTGQLETAWSPKRRIDAQGCVVAPGFVDAHVHLGAYLFAGRPYVPVFGPSVFAGADNVRVILPMMAQMCAMPVPNEVAAAVVRPVLAAMLRSGITGVVDAGGPGFRGVARAAAEIGIRAAIGPSLADQWHNEDGVVVRQAEPERLLDGAGSFVDEFDGAADGRVRAVVSAVAPMACSDGLLSGIAALGRSRELPIHVHSHVSAGGVKAHNALFGATETERLVTVGFLTERCVVMHAGFLTDDDIAAFSETSVTVNYNPVGNAMLGFGTTRGRSVARLLEAGVPLVLGSDYSPSTVPDPFQTVRAALMLQRDTAARDDALTLEQALAMANNSGAALGRPGQIGHITKGQIADLIVVDTSQLHHFGSDHPIPSIALRAGPADVQTVIVDGQVAVDQGHLVGVDEQGLLRDARRALQAVVT